MENKKIKLKLKVKLDNYGVTKQKIVSLKVSADYNQIVNVVPLIQVFNENINIITKIGDEVKELGWFKLNQLNFKNDGSSSISFNSITDDADLSNISELAMLEKDTEIPLLIKAELEN